MIRRRSGPDTAQVIEAIDVVAAESDERLPAEIVTLASDLRERLAGRLAVGPDHTVVALLGPTGSGKSSLTNALAGSEVVRSGVTRPTTSTTTAIVWDDDGTELLDWLDVSQRRRVGGGHGEAGLVLLDVPDFDSIAADHVAEMERIAARADVLVWVADPEKYADAALHARIAEAHGGETEVVAVLNKVDRLDAADAVAAVADLERLLAGNGLTEATVIGASTQTGHGVDAVGARLRAAAASRAAAMARIRAEARRVAELTDAHLAEDDLGDRVDRRRGVLFDELAEAAGIETITDAIVRGHRRDGLAVMGWPLTRWTRKLRAHPLRRLGLVSGSAAVASADGPVRRANLAEMSGVQRTRVHGAIRTSVDRVADGAPPPWPSRLATVATPDDADLADGLDVALGRAARSAEIHRRTPRWWQTIGVLQRALATIALVGLAWLAVLWVLAWFQIPKPPLPEYRGWPYPTLMAIGGAGAGWLLGLLVRPVLTRAGRFRARRFRKAARDEIESVADAAILEPLRVEAAVHDRLRAATRLLRSA